MNAMLRHRGIEAYARHIRRGGVYVVKTPSGWDVRYRDITSRKQERFFKDEAAARAEAARIEGRPLSTVQFHLDAMPDDEIEECCAYWVALEEGRSPPI